MLADDLRALAPRNSGWFTLDEGRVRAFADATEDWQAIHLDAGFAQQTPFGAPIAHGFLTLSMLSAMSYQVTHDLSALGTSVNYGFDRIRFVAPVQVGARIRGRFAVAQVAACDAQVDVHWDVAVEIDGADKPALVANWITRFYPA